MFSSGRRAWGWVGLALATLVLLLGAGCGADASRSGTTRQPLAALTYSSDWGSGYCANVTVTNDGPQATTAWNVVIAMNQSTLANMWSAAPTTSGDQVTASSLGWNAVIAPGGSTVFGFCANAPGSSNRPTIVAVNLVGNGGGGTGGAGTGGTPTGGASTGGTPTGGASTGGTPTGGASTGGTPTGGGPTAGPSYTVSIELPALVSADDVVVGTTRYLELSDRARLGGGANDIPAAVSLGTEGAMVGADAQLGHLYSRYGATLRDRAHLYGSLFTAAAVTRQGNPIVDGLEVGDYAFDPLNVTTWTIDYPAESGGNVSLEPDQPARSLEPGRYGVVSVKSRSRLVLSAGDYYFEELHVLEPQAELFIDDTDGPVRIHVRNALTTRGQLMGPGSEHPKPLFIVTGTSTLYIESAFYGFLVAPSSEVWIRRTSSGHAGSFFAKTIHVDADAVIEHVPFRHSDFYPDWVTSGNGELRVGWQASGVATENATTERDEAAFAEFDAEDGQVHENCDPGLKLVSTFDGIEHRTTIERRTAPESQDCVAQYRQCDEAGQVEPAGDLNSVPTSADVCEGAPDRFPCAIDETTIEWDDELGLCESDIDCLLYGKVCAVVCRDDEGVITPDCNNPERRCAAPVADCSATPAENYCETRRECAEPDVTGTGAPTADSDLEEESTIELDAEVPEGNVLRPYQAVPGNSLCPDVLPEIGPEVPEERSVESGNDKWGLRVEPKVLFKAKVQPQPGGNQDGVNVEANVGLDVVAVVWGKEVRLLDTEFGGKLTTCGVGFTKELKVLGFDIDTGASPPEIPTDTTGCEDPIDLWPAAYLDLKQSLMDAWGAAQYRDCLDSTPGVDQTAAWQSFCTTAKENALGGGLDGVDCITDPRSAVSGLIGIYEAQVQEFTDQLTAFQRERAKLSGPFDGLDLPGAQHTMNGLHAEIRYPIGPVVILIEIEVTGGWGLKLNLGGDYQLPPSAAALANVTLQPFANATAVAFAGVALGPAKAGIRGELLLVDAEAALGGYAGAVQECEGDDRVPPLPAGLSAPFAFESLFQPRRCKWDLDWGLLAGADLELLRGKVDLTARVKVGPVRKTWDKRIADWDGYGPYTYAFLASGTRKDSSGKSEFDPVSDAADLGTFGESEYFVDPSYLRGAPFALPAGSACTEPDLGSCYVLPN